ncbi:uncharacterized protein LOC119833331 [Zerene cesonia]|uniref:uncharacterized protein LOC119833331 n=1 Tax=Zerene cesonia TaxID=33412 RepID=UPI0018E4F236|nr:uncharacterized protein LOC119833331 [Zerene cesonia]
MTATAVPTSQAVAEWIRIFPKQATENYTSSVTFMKQLTVVAVSTITFLKNVLPEDCYMIETFGGIKLRILKKKCTDEWAQFLSTALTQAFDAFDKKYLHQLALCFYEDECKLENLVEYHIFEYSYNADGVTMNVHSKNRDSTKHTMRYSFENVREKTVQLIRACVVIMQSCPREFSTSYDVSLRLYYNENAPADYQAPGFVSTGDEDHLEPTIHEKLKLGWVETPYHKLVAHSFFKEPMKASHEANPTQNPPVLSNDMELSGSVQMSTPGSEVRLCCPCNKYGIYDACTPSELLTCYYCKLQQHAACFGVVRNLVSRVARHCCSKCYDVDPSRTPTDTNLASLSMRKRECLCIFRRTLELCSEVQTIEARDLIDKFDITESNAAKLMKLLHSNKIIQQDPQSNLTTPQKIMPDQLKTVMSNFFHTTEDKIVDRLLAESFASQESVPDPISDALSPMEKISLQNASNIARYVDNHTPIENNANNEELNEYREVVMSDAVESPDKRVEKRKLGDKEKTYRTGVKTKRAKVVPKVVT